MLIRIISLVILFFVLNYTSFLYAENDTFIYPRDKPSVFKKIEAQNKTSLDKIIYPKTKPSKEKKINKTVEKKIVTIEKKNPFFELDFCSLFSADPYTRMCVSSV